MQNQLATYPYAKLLLELNLIERAIIAIANKDEDEDNLFNLLFVIKQQKALAYSEDGKKANIYTGREEPHAIAQKLGFTQNLALPTHAPTYAERGLLTIPEAKKMVIARAIWFKHIVPMDDHFTVKLDGGAGPFTLCDYDHKPMQFTSYATAISATKEIDTDGMRAFIAKTTNVDRQPHLILYDQNQRQKTSNEP
jgi:hypothetical protein